MSSINTNAIDVNYPVPGTNNSSQGFRNNFASIKTNLDYASNEITDLQNKVVVKAALANTTLNNDMANTLISNASTRSFRETMYNLGNSLSGTVLVNASLGDVQYGNVSGNVTLQFGNWAPTGTKQTITLQLGYSNTSAFINFPTNVVYNNNNFGLTLVENYNGSGAISVPYNISQTVFELSTTDCGDTISITPVNRPYKATQIQTRTPPSTGQPGDVTGTICIDSNLNQIKITSTSGADVLTTTGNTTQFYTGMPVTFTGVSWEANIVVGNTYYVRNVVSSTTFTIATSSAVSSNLDLGGGAGNLYCNPISYLYLATSDYNSVEYNTTVTNINNISGNVTLNANKTNLIINNPIIFSGNSHGGVTINSVFYLKTVDTGSGNVTLSKTRYNGVAGPIFLPTSACTSPTGSTATFYIGTDIWRRLNLQAF